MSDVDEDMMCEACGDRPATLCSACHSEERARYVGAYETISAALIETQERLRWEGMVVGAALLAWANVLHEREEQRCTDCGAFGPAMVYDPRTMCEDFNACEARVFAALVERARAPRMTEEERREQAASFAFGQMALMKEWRDAPPETLDKLRALCRRLAGCKEDA